MISMLSAEIHCWNIFCVCLLCIAFFLDLLTVYGSTAFVVLWSGVNYYLYKRDENFRHRLSILGLIRHDKREQRRRSEHNSSKRAVYAGSVTPTSGTPSRLDCAFDYLRVTPGNKFDTPSRVLRRLEVDNGERRLVSPVFMSKTPFINRSCQSSFASDHGRKPQLDWVPAATRRLPTQQEKYPTGSYPAVCLNKSPLPLARPFASPELIAPVRVKILPLATSHIHNTFSQLSATSDADKQDPCSTESVIQALKERRKRAAAAAYQDSLDAACHSPSQAQSSKRPRRDPLCAVPLPPPFAPVATSVGGFGPPYLGSPSKNAAAVRPPMPSGLGPMPEGPFKRGRLPSSSSPPSSGGKRHKNNAIAVSYCSSRSIRLQNQSQKRKAMPLDPSPLSKHTKKEERKLQADDGEASKENSEDSLKENNAPSEASELSAETREADNADTTKQRGRVRPIDWSTIQKKKLVYPEHMATLKEHENDQALDRERLSRLLGSLQDPSENSNGEAPIATAEASALVAPAASLPFLTPPTATTAAPLPGSTTNTVSVISSPVMSVSSTMASSSSSPKPADGVAVATSAAEASTPVVSAASTPIEPPASTKPQFGAGFFGLSSSASPSASSTATPSTLLPTTAPAAISNPLLRGLTSAASPKTTTAISTLPLSTPFQLPTATSNALPAPSSVSTAASSAPSFTATAVKPDQPTGGFVFSGPSLGGNIVVPKAPPSSPAFGAPAAVATSTPAILPTFTASNTSAATSSVAAPTLTGSTPFQFGSNTQAAATAAQPFKFGSGEQPAVPPSTLPAGTGNSTQAPATSSLPSGVFKFGATAPASQITPSASQATSMASTNMFNFGSGNTTAKLATATSPPAFGSTNLQSPLGAATGIGAQPNSGGFAFGAATTAPASGATATSPNFAFGSSNPAASTGTAPFKFGAATPLAPATTTAAAALAGAPFAFGASAQKPGGMQPSFAFGAATTTSASTSAPFAFGAAPAATATTPFAFGAPATTNASGAPFAFGGAGTTGGAPAFPLSSATGPLFPSAAPLAQAAQTGGFQFGAPAATPQGAFGAATNGLSNGISTSSAASQPGTTAPPGLFKFGATNNSAAMPGFQFNAGATPKPSFNFGGAPVMTPAANNSLFSIGTASSNSERPMARPRSKRVVKK